MIFGWRMSDHLRELRCLRGIFGNWTRNEPTMASNRTSIVPRSSTNDPLHCVAVSQVSKLIRWIRLWESPANVVNQFPHCTDLDALARMVIIGTTNECPEKMA